MDGNRKIGVVGLGRVGTTLAYGALLKGLASEMVFVNRTRDKAVGEALDLLHAAAFETPVRLVVGDYADLAGASAVILTASVPSRPGMTSRLDLGRENVALFREIVPAVAAACPEAVLLVVSNPVDVLTLLTLRLSGLPPERVVGAGTVIDSGRFRALLAEQCGIHPMSIHAYVLGEHGETSFAAASAARVGGVPVGDICRVCPVDSCGVDLAAVFNEVRQAGFTVFRHKGYTNFAIASATLAILEAILSDSRRILPVSVLADGYLGVRDVCLSLPAVLGRRGVVKVVELDLSPEEAEAFRASARFLKEAAASLGVA